MGESILQEINDLDEPQLGNIDELKKVKGEKLVKFETEDLNSIKQFILTFKTLNQSDTGETRKIFINAQSITFFKQDSKLENVCTRVNVDQIINKRLLEYEDWHTETLTDTGNLTGPQYNLTLSFEDGYSIEIYGYR
jgi:hypothetical protein